MNGRDANDTYFFRFLTVNSSVFFLPLSAVTSVVGQVESETFSFQKNKILYQLLLKNNKTTKC